ncbi:uncharacterized protein LOC112171035 [Rosa chinensis]|uniref:uncharacterized protein LOC112171035 n=1 Tax=Rosa chinensis TaxID=74649 RepID=UPI000D088072|nr:uncharacterized protein LOC112171035 [Rosa chinensis]
MSASYSAALFEAWSTVPTDVEQEADYETDDEDLLYENSSEDQDYVPRFDNEDYDEYGLDDDWLGDMDVEFNEVGQWIGGVGQGSSSAGVENEADVDDFDNETMHGVVESDEECIGNEVGSDGEEDGDGFPEFNPKTDMHNPQFCVGMKFATTKILRAAVRERAIQKWWEALFVKSDRDRIKVICKDQNFPFELYASKMQHVNTLHIKTYNPAHTCARVNDNSMIRFACLTEALAQAMSARVKVRVSNQQAYRTKKATLALLEADIKEQYARIRDYGDELRRADLNTTIDIKCDFNEDPDRPAKHWSRAHFGTHLKCDILLNNLSESFNAFIVPARKKPIVSCFEEIRVKLMRRIQVMRDKMLKHEDTICPKPREILEKNKVKAATDCIPSGSAIYYMRHAHEEYVDQCYLKKTYMAIYANTIKPVIFVV